MVHKKIPVGDVYIYYGLAVCKNIASDLVNCPFYKIIWSYNNKGSIDMFQIWKDTKCKITW